MRVLQFVFRMVLSFAAVFGVGITVLLLLITGGVGPSDVSLFKEGFSQAYVSGLKGVEQTARHLRGDFCHGDSGRAADCG